MPTKKSYAEKTAVVYDWYQIQMDYWHKYMGDMYNHPDHWEDAFHSPSTEDWWDLFDVADVLKRQHPNEWRHYGYLSADLDELQRRLMFNKSIVVRNKKDHNHPMFRFWMAFKDFLNDVAGTPTHHYTEAERRAAREQANPSPFETLFDIK